eukprot:TRINITY_DN1351_c0_g1_i1.p1 TRINITY_DN1351_c0_g1~~TRINITY_DN1351_c0_g1_i1.p1  ORF type:complete len:266 (+),score=40.29 TRINITY_DN1351_c0_g1_i1:526-1323(+)
MDARFLLSVAAFVALIAILLLRSWREQQMAELLGQLTVRVESGAGSGGAAASEGLPQSVSRALPTVTFSHGTFSGHQEPVCVICLADFESKDTLRQLPECCHAFHVDCIDQWFDKHTTCPICRMSLLPVPPAPLPPEPPFPAMTAPAGATRAGSLTYLPAVTSSTSSGSNPLLPSETGAPEPSAATASATSIAGSAGFGGEEQSREGAAGMPHSSTTAFSSREASAAVISPTGLDVTGSTIPPEVAGGRNMSSGAGGSFLAIDVR